LNNNLLAVDFAGIKMPNPTALASGILGYSGDSLQMIAENGAGAVVTKSIGIAPRTGYSNPTVVQTASGLINAMGLPNPGINEYAEELTYAKSLLKIPLIVSVFGYTAEEYALVAKKAIEVGADAVELNVSCPHVKYTGSEIGANPKLLTDVVCKVKAEINKPLIVKLSPNVTDITEIAKAAVKAGADALTVINTVRAMAIDIETQSAVLHNIRGGLSGPAIKPIALRCVFDIYEVLPQIPLIGCGGVTNWVDAIEFFLAGASAVQIGTAVATEQPAVFQCVNKGVTNYLKRKKYGSVKEIVGLSHQG
jgi:dihydroorotate dehydrogenase (NAD+) catalytic subunit